jgi:hypothetical protein
MMPKKIWIEQRFYTHDLDFDRLEAVVAQFRTQIKDPGFVLEQEYDDACMVFSGWREETKEERKARLEKARKERLAKMKARVAEENKEKAELARLLHKYHGIEPEELHEWPT